MQWEPCRLPCLSHRHAYVGKMSSTAGLQFLQLGMRHCSGESEARVRQLFQEAQDVAPSIIFIGMPIITIRCATPSHLLKPLLRS